MADIATWAIWFLLPQAAAQPVAGALLLREISKRGKGCKAQDLLWELRRRGEGGCAGREGNGFWWGRQALKSWIPQWDPSTPAEVRAASLGWTFSCGCCATTRWTLQWSRHIICFATRAERGEASTVIVDTQGAGAPPL